jgi:DNA-binding winged helix-turn-helix (wHTH) protein
VELSRRPRLSLFDAMCASGDPKLVSEMRALKAKGADVPYVFVRGGSQDREESRYPELSIQLENSLRETLLTGDLVAYGYETGGALDQSMIRIRPDRWRVLEPNFDKSSANSGGSEIIGIIVIAPVRSAAKSPMPNRISPDLFRLVIKAASMVVTVDGTLVPPRPQPFKLLLLLAEAARDSSGVVPNAVIEQHLFHNAVVSTRAVSDSIRSLRELLKEALGDGFDSRGLVQNRAGVGYLLNLRSEQVLILP